jgi:3-oxoadipate enol-lactonase
MTDELFMEHAGVRLHYRIDGDELAPWLMLSNSLGTNLAMWEPQMPGLLQHFRVLRSDTRGHGLSNAPSASCSIADLGRDAIALLDHIGITQTHFCGLSLGGMTGMWLAANQSTRIGRLVLCNTSPLMAPPANLDTRIALVTKGGMASIAGNVIDRWFTADFQARSPASIAIVHQMLLETPAAGYAACCAAIRDMDQRASLASISHPTLVIAGTRDIATPPQDGKLIAERVAGSTYIELDAAHLSNWEQAAAFSACLSDFLQGT